jgi:peptide deformylase
MLQPIVLYSSSNNVLRTETKQSDIKNGKDDLQKLIGDMKDTLQLVGGLGLAANQLGRNESICLVQLGEKLITMVNPFIVNSGGEKKISMEGCLSIPDVTIKVERDEIVSVKFVNPDNDWQEEEIRVEFPHSVIVQHEVDHLNGILMIDYISPMQNQLIQTKLKKINRGNANINYVGMVWRNSSRSWSLVGPFHKLVEYYNYHSTNNSLSDNGEINGIINESEIIVKQEEATQTQENPSGQITEHKIIKNA